MRTPGDNASASGSIGVEKGEKADRPSIMFAPRNNGRTTHSKRETVKTVFIETMGQ